MFCMLIIPQSDSQSASVAFQQAFILSMPPSIYRNLKECIILLIIFQYNDTKCRGLYLMFFLMYCSTINSHGFII